MQTIILSGNLTSNCEITKAKDGREFIKFAVAAKEFNDDKPTFYSCRMPKTAISESLTKGRRVTILGQLKVEVNVKDDKTYVNLDVWVNNLELGAHPKQDGSENS